MSNKSPSELGVKRKARDLDDYDKNDLEPCKEDDFRATEEELKRRKIVKVVRNSNQLEIEKSQRGRFSFSKTEETVEHFTGKKESGDDTKSNIKTNPHVTTTKVEINSFSNKKSLENVINETTATNKINSNPFIAANSNNNFTSKRLNTGENPFKTGQNQQATPYNPFLSTNPHNVIPNPFVNFKSSNPFNINQNQENFSNFSSTKPFINFNLNQASENPNWNESDEEDGANVNPEEEVKIENKQTIQQTQVIIPRSTNVKFVKHTLNNLLVYNFADKKWQSVGQGELSIELAKTDKGMVVAFCVYRNSVLKILFKANFVKNVTTHEPTSKNFKHYGIIQKLFNKNESTGKNEPKSIKFPFSSEKESEDFQEKFKDIHKILETNDLSHFDTADQTSIQKDKTSVPTNEEEGSISDSGNTSLQNSEIKNSQK